MYNIKIHIIILKTWQFILLDQELLLLLLVCYFMLYLLYIFYIYEFKNGNTI